ncbi:MAG: SDR family oxidoreductase [Rhodospirillaceae bacterium]|nr:SDR family oxidoreductase [Rhodospirillales bacterium]
MAAELGTKVVVITGASSGIGRAAAQAFARQGSRLVLAARSQAALEIAARECTDAGGEAIPFACDVTQFDDMAALAQTAKQRFGQLDVWVNDAGVHMLGRFDDLPLEDFRQVIDVNLMGTVHGCRAALPVFRAQGHGVIINIASMAGAIGQPYASAYVASKWAVRGLSEALRMELLDAPGIHVCTVLPPSIDTPLFQHAANVAGRAVQPVPPVHSPEELADIIVALAAKPEREVFMGMSRLITVAHAMAPAATERLMARAVAKRHFRNSPSARSRGNLFSPQIDAVHGGWGNSSNRTKMLTIAAAAMVAVPVGIYAWRRLRGQSAYV